MSLREASLADVIRAFRHLSPGTDDERRAIARLLGFDLPAKAPSREPHSPPAPTVPDGAARIPAPTATPSAAALSPQAGDPVALIPLDDVRDNALALPRPLARPAARVPMAIEPLFAATWSRAIVGRLVARVAARGALDVDRLVDAVARREPLRVLPRLRRLVSATEVTVAIDTSGAMGWFHDDGALLTKATHALSRAPVTVTFSDGAPTLAAAGVGEDVHDEGPARVTVGSGGRVVALTDLGLASPWTPPDPAALHAWGDLAASLRARGASLVVVTPVSPSRVPPHFHRAVPCLHWDRATTPGLAHRLVKELR